MRRDQISEIAAEISPPILSTSNSSSGPFLKQNAQRLSFYEFPRDVSRVSAGHVTIAVFNQLSQVWMRDVLHRGDLALYAKILSAIEVQLQSYNVIRSCSRWPRSSSRPKNYSLTTNPNFGTKDVAVTQRSFYIRGHKPVDIPVHSHTGLHVSGRFAYVSLPQNLTKL